jgi:hypothetical protein
MGHPEKGAEVIYTNFKKLFIRTLKSSSGAWPVSGPVVNHIGRYRFTHGPHTGRYDVLRGLIPAVRQTDKNKNKNLTLISVWGGHSVIHLAQLRPFLLHCTNSLFHSQPFISLLMFSCETIHLSFDVLLDSTNSLSTHNLWALAFLFIQL